MKQLKMYAVAVSLSLALVLATPAQAYAPVHKQVKLAPKVVNLAISHPKAYALKLLTLKGIAKEYSCLVDLWQRESGWRYKAKNHSSTALGIAQLLIETSLDPATQIRNGLRYINYRYENSPCKALGHSYRLGWY